MTCATMDQATIRDRLRALSQGVDPDHPNWRAEVLGAFQRRHLAGDHLAPWLALSYARGWGVAVPGWALDFFCIKAVQLNDVLEDPGGLSEAEAVGDALGFGALGRGQRSLAHKNAQRERERRMAMKVAIRTREVQEQGRVEKREATVALIAEMEKVSVSTVWRAVRNCPDAAAQVAKLLKPLDCQDSSIS